MTLRTITAIRKKTGQIQNTTVVEVKPSLTKTKRKVLKTFKKCKSMKMLMVDIPQLPWTPGQPEEKENYKAGTQDPMGKV